MSEGTQIEKRQSTSKGATRSCCDPRQGDIQNWTFSTTLLTAFLIRMLLICYARVHDYLFEVSFTDVDYKVFSDAAAHVREGRSPFERATYRYTPLLAWLLLPNTVWPEFGKVLFCALDILVGWLCYELCCAGLSRTTARTLQSSQGEPRSFAKNCVVAFWLANPLVAVISSRGNADVLVCASVLCTLYLIHHDKLLPAALMHGLFAVHLKLYPVIYLPSIFLYLSSVRHARGYFDYWEKLLSNWKGYTFALVSVVGCVLSFWLCYIAYGNKYVHEALLYHMSRTDTRHNFSPYFYVLYLVDENPWISRLVGFGAFVPQAALILWFAFRYHDDLPFCWFITTVAFVAFNKVCTSQYFIWYICLLPVAQASVQMSLKEALWLISLWFGAQAAWLLPAYLFEFRGYNTFVWMWIASLAFLVVNCAIIAEFCRNYAREVVVVKAKKVE